MQFRLAGIRSIRARCKYLDQHMVATQTESCCLQRHPRIGAFELVGEDAQFGGTALAIAWIIASMPAASSAGNQQVPMNVRRPSTGNGSNTASKRP